MPINYDRSVAAAFTALVLAATGVILDAGCGSGRRCMPGTGWREVVASSPWTPVRAASPSSKRRASAAGRREPRVQFRLGDVRRLTELDLPALDGVLAHCSVNVLPADADKGLALRQLGTVLRPGGRCVLVVPSERYQADDVWRMRTGSMQLSVATCRRGSVSPAGTSSIRSPAAGCDGWPAPWIATRSIGMRRTRSGST